MTVALLLAVLVTAQTVELPREPREVFPAVERAIATGDTAALQSELARMAARESERALGLFGLAVLDLSSYRYDAADGTLEQLVTDHAGGRIGAWSAYALGVGSMARGRLQEAIPHLERAVQDARRLPDSALEGRSLILLGPLMARNRGPAAGVPHLDRAEEVLAPEDRRGQARLRCVRGLLLMQLGDPGVLDMIASGRAQAAEDDLRGQGVCAHARAAALVHAGDLDAADEAFEESQRLFERAGDLGNLAVILQWKGWGEWNASDYVNAYPHLHQALALAERTSNASAAGWAATNLAQIAVSFNDHARASARLREARESFEASADTAGLRAAANVRATHLASIGAYGAADSIFHQLVDFADRHGIIGWSMGLRGSWTEMRIRQGDLAAAERLLAEARAVIERGDLHAWSPPFDRIGAYLALRNGDLDRADQLLDRAGRAFGDGQVGALYGINTLRAEVLLQRGRPDAAYQRALLAADQLERERQALSVDALRRMVFQGGGLARIAEASTAAVIAGLASNGNVAGAYAIAERRRGRELLDRTVLARSISDGFVSSSPREEPAPHSLNEVQRLLPDRETALIQYATGPNGAPTTAFVIAPDTAFAVVVPSHDSLRPTIEDFLAGVRGGRAPDAVGRELGRLVLDPVLGRLPPDVRRLLLVPDGALYRVPFAALRIDGDVYAIERYSLTYAPSGTVAVRPRDPGDAEGVRLLAVGDPAYGEPDALAAAFRDAYDEGGGLPRIRWSGREARRVARYADRSVVLVGDKATEAAIKRLELAEYDVVHLATHALVDEGTVLRTSLALAPGEGEDGFLSVGELTQLRLDADLVVLSGCRTAGGQLVAGEGLLGLSGPLLSAGAGVVVGTQWSVEDRAVRPYVEDLYDHLADGATIADALRMAQLAGLERGDPVRDWAVFAATGNPTVRVALERPPWWKFW